MARSRRRNDDLDDDEFEPAPPASSGQGAVLMVVIVVGIAGVVGALLYRNSRKKEQAKIRHEIRIKELVDLGRKLVTDLYIEAEAMVRAGDANVDTSILKGYMDNENVIDALVVRRKGRKSIYVGSASGRRPVYGVGSDRKRKSFKDNSWRVTDAGYRIGGKDERVWLFARGVYDEKDSTLEIGRVLVFIEPPPPLKR